MAETLNNSQIRQRIDSHANWNSINPVLADGEMAISNDKNDFKIGDGVKQWQIIDYAISNNQAVQTAQTAASNAQTTANAAQTAASNAMTTATQALSASGRKEPKSKEDPYGNHTNVTITVNNDFVEKFRNYDFESTKGETDLTIAITSTNKKYYDYANEIRFHFMTAGICKIAIPNGTRNIAAVDESNKIMVVQEGDVNLDLSDPANVILQANVVVEVRFINTWLVKIVANKL
jgi:uncharacterized protein (DUF4415 family)